MPIIDAHSHLWTPDTLRYPLAPSFAKADMKPPSWTDAELLAHCRPAGVARVVLIQMSFYGWDNSYMLDRMRAHMKGGKPGVFGGVAVIDWTAEKPDLAMAEMARGGVRGFRVRHTDPPAERWLETPGFERMFRYAADHGLTICPLMDPRGLPSLTRMCAKHPKTTVVIDHFCRIGLDGEIRERDVDALCAMARFPRVHVKISAF